jgi:hypothetical protein
VSAAGPTGDDAELVDVAVDVHAWVEPDGAWWVNNTATPEV